MAIYTPLLEAAASNREALEAKLEREKEYLTTFASIFCKKKEMSRTQVRVANSFPRNNDGCHPYF